MGDENPIRTLGDYSRPSHEGYRNTIELPDHQDRKTSQRYPDVPTTSWRIFIRSMDSRTIDQSTGGKLRDLNPKEYWAILEDLALYENESWNDPRDFVKPIKAIALPQDVSSTSDRRLIEAHLALT
ncbi:hypothetical protein Tco_0161738 [Tanacetum coccineum]